MASGVNEQDVSKGIDPVQGHYDILADRFWFRVDGRQVWFDSRRLPFTMLNRCADKALILKHENQAR